MSEWISVKERLPKEEGAYLTWDDEDPAIWGFYEGKWCHPASYSPLDPDCSVVTHWMPLPDPPKGERDGGNE